MDFAFHFTDRRWHAVELVRRYASQFDVVVSVGGDGTLNEILNGAPELDVPLGLIPIGTGNDFARSCKIPYDDIPAAVEILLRHDVRYLDLGIVNGRRFINALGTGFAGRVNDLGMKLSWLRGTLKYLVAISVVFFTYRRRQLKVVVDDHVEEGKMFLVSVGNGPFVGGGLQLTPQACLTDGIFGVCLIRRIPRWKIVWNFAKLYSGQIDEMPEVELLEARKLTLESPRPIPMHLDGERLDPPVNRLEIQILPKAQPFIGNWKELGI